MRRTRLATICLAIGTILTLPFGTMKWRGDVLKWGDQIMVWS